MRVWARRMLNELNGMFALVIYDSQTGRACSRPATGWASSRSTTVERGGFHTFASEIAAVLELHPDHQVDEFAIRQYQKLRTFFNGRTLYTGISMFPAGCYLKNGRVQRYWDLPDGPQEPPSDEELRELVTTAVKYRNLVRRARRQLPQRWTGQHHRRRPLRTARTRGRSAARPTTSSSGLEIAADARSTPRTTRC